MEQKDLQVRKLLQNALECLNSRKPTAQELLQLIKEAKCLENLNDKGVFISLIAQIYLKAGRTLMSKIQFFQNKLFKGASELANKKKKTSAKGRTRNYRAKIKVDRQLEQLMQDALDNPSNIQQEQKLQSVVEDSNNTGSNPSKPSSGLSQEAMKENYKEITQQLQDDNPHHNIQKQEYQEHHGEMTNYEIDENNFRHQMGLISREKINFFKDIAETSNIMTKPRRKKKQGNQTRTKYVAKNNTKLDQRSIIDEDHHQKKESLLNQTKLSKENQVRFAFIQKNIPIPKFREIDYNQETLRRLKELDDQLTEQNEVPQKKERQNEGYLPNFKTQQEIQEQNYPDMFTQSQIPFTSQNISFNIQRQEMKFEEILSEQKKNPARLFVELLKKNQNDEVDLQQEDPDQFSQIIVRKR